MKTEDLLIAVALAMIFAAVFATLFDLLPVIAKAMVRQAARWWKSDVYTPEELTEEWQALIEERPIGILKIGTGLQFWIRGAIHLIRFADNKQTTRASHLLLKLAEIPGLALLKLTNFAGLAVSYLRVVVSWVMDCLPCEPSWQPRLSLGRSFRWYFAASIFSNTGTWLQNTAQVVLAYQLTHSILAIGLIVCAQFSSPLLLGPWAAVVPNRSGSWRTLMVTQLVSAIIAATLAALQFSGTLSISLLFTGTMAIGLAFTFALPAQSATVTGLVPQSEIKRALAMESLSYNLGRTLGPVFSVFIIVTVGPGWAFATNTASFLSFTIVLLWLGPRYIRRRPNSPGATDGLPIAGTSRG